MLGGQDAQGTGIEHEEAPGRRGEAEPAGGQHPEEMTVGHGEGVAGDGSRPLDHPIGAAAHLGRRLPLGHAVAPEVPAGTALLDLGRREALVGAVVPLHEVGIDLTLETGQGAGVRSPYQGAGEDLGELRETGAPQECTDGLGLTPANVEEGNVRAPRVLTTL